jgi:hypothetical protein
MSCRGFIAVSLTAVVMAAVAEALRDRERTLQHWADKHREQVISAFEDLESALLERTFVYTA